MQIMLKGAELLEKWANDTVADLRSAMAAVLHRGVYDLYRLGVKDLRGGRLGLKSPAKFKNIHNDPRFESSKRFFKMYWQGGSKPLARMAPGITYFIDKAALLGEVGFRAHGKMAWYADKAALHARGFDWHRTPEDKRALHSFGIHLKKGTEYVKVPSRDIMGAIKNNFAVQVLQSMKQNFEIKKGGGRF